MKKTPFLTPVFCMVVCSALIACSTMPSSSEPDEFQASTENREVDLYLPSAFAGKSEIHSGFSGGYEVTYERVEPEIINTGSWEISLPSPIKLQSRLGLVGSVIQSNGTSIHIPDGHTVHRFSASRDKQVHLNGVCISDIDASKLDNNALAQKLKSIHKGKNSSRDLFNCFMYKPGSEHYFQLVMINDYGVGKMTRGLLTDGSKSFLVQDLKGLVDLRTQKYVKGYNLVGYQISEDKEILSALRILNSYKTWFRKNIDEETRQALAATMSVLSKSYNSRYRGAVVSRNMATDTPAPANIP